MDPMTMAMLASAASGVIGGIFGGSKKSSTTEPPKYVKQNQKQLYSQANKAYKQAVATAPTDFYAELDPVTKQGLAGIQNFATGQGADVAADVLGAGTGNLQAGSAGALGAAGGLLGAASRDPTLGNIVSAGQYANNPYLDQLIDASSRDVVRNLTEQVLPGYNRNASITGNANSTRTGIAEGLALRGAQDRIGDIASTIRAGAWDTGLATAEQAREANLGGLQAAGGIYGDIAGFGLDAAGTGANMTFNNLDALVKAGQISQADAQGIINGTIQANQYQLGLLGQKAQATGLGSVNPGSTTTSGGGIGGVASGVLGGASAGLGIYNAYNQLANPKNVASGGTTYANPTNLFNFAGH